VSGIMPLSRELGRYIASSWSGEADPVAELTPIAKPVRPSRGRWSPEAWAEIQAIYATPDPFEENLG
jgi:hypothetical protein